MLKGRAKIVRKREKGQALAESFLMYTLVSVVAISALMALGWMFMTMMGVIHSALEVAGVFG